MKKILIVTAGLLAAAIAPGMLVSALVWRMEPPLNILLSWVVVVTDFLPSAPVVVAPCLAAAIAASWWWVRRPTLARFVTLCLVGTITGPCMWLVINTSGIH